MNKIKIVSFFIFLGVLAVSSCKNDDDDGGGGIDCSTITFSGDIAPIIQNSCSIGGCHDAGSVNGDYTTYAGLETKAKDGTMEQEVITDMTMPKSGSLTQTELDQIQCWLDAGAPDN